MPASAPPQKLYDAECALLVAHQTHVGQWIAAANDRLHDALVAHFAAMATFRQVPAGRL